MVASHTGGTAGKAGKVWMESNMCMFSWALFSGQNPVGFAPM